MELIGVDECGLGPIAGPCTVAAVVFLRHRDLKKAPVQGLRDSKKLSHNRRAELEEKIREQALHWVIAQSNSTTIDRHGIAACKRACMRACILRCRERYPEALAIVDGNDPVQGVTNLQMMVKADDKVAAVSAASILAKVFRDRYMVKMAYRYPKYGFERHMGYPTKAHKEALRKFGVCPQHRRSYKPVMQLLEGRATI